MSDALPSHPYELVANLMAGFPGPWFLCGGWAADAWLGRTVRAHGDIDISVFHDGHLQLFEHLAGWHLVPHDAQVPGDSIERWHGRPLTLPAHIHARPPAEGGAAAIERWVRMPGDRERDGLDVEFIVNEREGENLVLSRQPRIELPLDRAVRQPRASLPVAAPEVLMFFKATAYWDLPGYPRAHDVDDFVALAELLTLEDREWLVATLRAVRADHPWLGALAELPQTPGRFAPNKNLG